MRLFLFFLFLGFAAEPVLAKTVGTASFHAVGEGLALDINGEGGKVDAELTKTGTKIAGVFKVKLSDFKTGIALRDEHLQKTLESDKYPWAKFTLSEVEAKDGKIAGTLELHGKSVAYSGDAVFKGNQVSVKGKIKLTDFGITPPEYKLAKVANEVEITVDLAL